MKLNRYQQRRVATIRQWLREQERNRILLDDPLVKQLETLFEKLLPGRSAREVYDTPVSHVRYLLALIDHESHD